MAEIAADRLRLHSLLHCHSVPQVSLHAGSNPPVQDHGAGTVTHVASHLP